MSKQLGISGFQIRVLFCQVIRACLVTLDFNVGAKAQKGVYKRMCFKLLWKLDPEPSHTTEISGKIPIILIYCAQ